MKSAIASCLLLALALAGAAGAQNSAHTGGLGKTPGQEYVRLTDWAKGRGLEVRWLKPDETLELNNHSSKLALAVDCRQAQFNGVQVWLFFPVVAENGAVWLAQLDADLTLRPLLSPLRSQPGTKIKTVCLDPGHGGKDPGNQLGTNQEKRYTLLLAQEVRKQLARAGLKVTLTRSSDSFVELPARPELAKRKKADLFVSLHFNAADNGRSSVQGAEVYCLTPAGVASTNARGEGAGAGSFTGNRFNHQNLFLAYEVQRALTRNLTVEDRGVRRARFAVLRDAAMPAVLIEAGFMSHPEEGRKIFTPTYRQQVARAIVEGLLAYKRAVERGT
jgi:N-acetylmuramoyl-L-alanine amidase